MKKFYNTAYNKIDKLNHSQVKSSFARLNTDIQFLLSVCNSLGQGIIVTNLSGKVLFANKLAQTQCKKNIDDGDFVWDILPTLALSSDVKNAIKNQMDFAFKEYIIQNTSYKDEVLPHRSIRATLLPLVETTSHRNGNFDTKEITGSILCLEDVSDINRSNTREYRDKSFSSMRYITAGIAHEIKNPLAAMGIHLQLLKKKVDTWGNTKKADQQKINNYLRVIEEEIQKLDKVVSVFLNDFKIPQADLEPQNINDILDSLKNLVKPSLDKHTIILQMALSSSLPKVFVSRYAISYALLNIIKNAEDVLILDTKEQTVENPTLGITSFCKNGKVYVTITDNGHGISDDIKKAIFDPYFTTKADGSGIGLPIAYNIVRRHRGDLVLDQSYNEGTRFIVSFPAYASEQQLLE